MRQNLSDEQILNVIQTLHASHQTVTGESVRTQLHKQFKHRGGVGRVYDALKKWKAKSELPATVDHAYVAHLEAELKKSLEREKAHQDYWAERIYEARREGEAFRERAAQASRNAENYLKVYRELVAANAKIEELEQALKVANRSSTSQA